MAAQAPVRLYISPLNESLLPVVLGPRLSAIVQNVSYHKIPAFPENDYGYIDLPGTDALALKKKLHDAILKGRKMKIEEARPKKRKLGSDREAPELDAGSQSPRPTTKEKPNPRVLRGRELSPDQKVKRGWTESKVEKIDKKKTKDKKEKVAKKSQPASKYTEDSELLFRTEIPPNKKDLKGDKRKKGSDKKPDTKDLVHEFEHRTKHASFLKDGAVPSNPSIYIDGKGWVDGDGKVTEPESRGTKRKRQAAVKGLEISIPPPKVKVQLKTSSPSTSSESDVSDDDASTTPTPARIKPVANVDDTSSSGSSVVSSEDEDDASGQSATSSTPNRDNTQPNLHPLEALFKKPKAPASQDVVRPSLEVETEFAFFGNNDDTDEEQLVPATPFTSQDLRTREIRSAAPTPQTATVSRFNSVGSDLVLDLPAIESVDDTNDTAQNTRANSKLNSTEPETERDQSEFEKRFWEERGANNRAWKARRKAVMKEKRQRDNRGRRPKNW